MLAHLITEPAPASPGPLDPALEARVDSQLLAAEAAYEAALGWDEAAWVPSRRRPAAVGAVPVA